MPLTEPTRLVLAKTYVGVDDPDAADYIARVEAADETASPGVGVLETATKVAIHSFVKGCKADGIWPAIKASCILAGARTLNGALVPLVGTAPTNYNFVAGDYNRKTGLVGNGSTKYLDSNRANNADPQNNNHNSVYITVLQSGSANNNYLTSSTGAGGNQITTASNNSTYAIRSRTGTAISTGITVSGSEGFIGHARSSSEGAVFRAKSSTSALLTGASQTPDANNLVAYRVLTIYSSARLAFYSIGEALDLALLDARVTDLINAFGAAIP